MRTFDQALVVCSLVLSSPSASARAPTTEARRRASPDFYGAYAEDARLARVVPLIVGALPDLTRGVELRPTWGPGVDPDLPPGLAVLRDGDVLLIGRGATPGWLRLLTVDRIRGIPAA